MKKGEIPEPVRQAARLNFAAGYQAALRDIGMKMLEEGIPAGVTWIIDNSLDNNRTMADDLRKMNSNG